MNNKEFKYVSFQLVLKSLSICLPLIMLDAPFWLMSAILFIVISPLVFPSLSYTTILMWIYDITRLILYIWALVVTISGTQDFLAIVFYILFGLQIFSIISSFLYTIMIIYSAITKK